MRRLIRISLALVTSGVVLFLLLLAASIHSFFALTEETLIAELEFERVDDRRWIAALRTGDFCSEKHYPIYGDQWRIDAQFLKWHYWATLFGLESQYRLERLEGRYSEVTRQNTERTQAHALAAPSAIDIGGLSGRLGNLNFLADASYGSSTFHDIEPGRIYLVYKSPTGIFTRSRPVTMQRGDVPVTVEVRRGCNSEPGLWARSAGWINRTADPVD